MDERRTPIERTRASILSQLETSLEIPMAVLGLVWLGLMLLELLRGESVGLSRAATLVWALFGAEFLLRFGVAPKKTAFLRRNWVTLLSLALPAVRVFRLSRTLRVLRLARGVRVLRLMTSLNRGLRSLRRTLRRRGLGYVTAATVIVTLVGAAGMRALEAEGAAKGSFATYGDALWWTAMMMTTMGSDAWPATAEGRFLCVALAIWAFVVFGYLTASLASYFIGQDVGGPGARAGNAAPGGGFSRPSAP